MTGSQTFATTLLVIGQSVDETIGGPPIFTVIIRALWVREEHDIAEVELRLLRQEHEQAQSKLKESANALERKRAHAANLETKVQTAAANLQRHLDLTGDNLQEQVFLDQYQSALRELVQLGDATRTLAEDPNAVLLNNIPSAPWASADAGAEATQTGGRSAGTGEG